MSEHPIMDHVKALVNKSYAEHSAEIEAFLKRALTDNPDYYIYETWYTVRTHPDGFNVLYKVILAYRFDPSITKDVYFDQVKDALA